MTSLHKYCRSHSNVEKLQLFNVSFPRFCKLFGIQLEPLEPSSVQSEEEKDDILPRDRSQKTSFVQSFGRHWVPFCGGFIAIMACEGRERLREKLLEVEVHRLHLFQKEKPMQCYNSGSYSEHIFKCVNDIEVPVCTI